MRTFSACSSSESAMSRDVVSLVDTMPRVRQPIGQFAVIGQEKKPGALEIEPTDAEEPGPGEKDASRRSWAIFRPCGSLAVQT